MRADSSDDVAAVAASIRQGFDGASVTTAEDLADRVSGSLVDARRLADRPEPRSSSSRSSPPS